MLANAINILNKNLYTCTLNGVEYRRTVPSRQFYVHQWFWDSAVHSMALAHIDVERAFDELFSLTAGQWENGFLAHISFNPQESRYFPGAHIWHTEDYQKGEIKTSGITQPPIIGIALHYICSLLAAHESGELIAKYREKIYSLAQAVGRFHSYLWEVRSPPDDLHGLLTIIHPWESGLDNSPRWDMALAAIEIDSIPAHVKQLVQEQRSDAKSGKQSQRPSLEDYYRYLYLVDEGNKRNWDYHKKDFCKNFPFAVKDIFFTSIFSYASECMAKVFLLLEDDAQASLMTQYAKQSAKALEKTWVPESQSFFDIAITGNRQQVLCTDTIAKFSPLLTGASDSNTLELLLDSLTDPAQYWTPYRVPTTAVGNPSFDALRYWRGPVWPITNYLIILALERYTSNERCQQIVDSITDSTCELVEKFGFWENYDAHNATRNQREQTGLGFGEFSWTAAIYILLHAKGRMLSDAITNKK